MKAREPKSMVEAATWWCRYFYNVPHMEIVQRVYGKNPDASIAESQGRLAYLNSKCDDIKERGPGYWWGTLDIPHQKALAEAIKERYGKVE